MALQLGQTFSRGVRRVLTRTGGVLLVALLAVQLLVQTSINTAVIGLFPPEAAGELEAVLGLTLPVSATTAGILFLGGLVASTAYFVILSRALTRPLDELSTFPSRLYTRRIGRATLSMLVGGIVVGFSVFVGTMFFFLPGVFLSICFLFFMFAVGVEDRGVLDALKRSWGLSRGNRLKLAVLVILAAGIGMAVGVTGTLFDMANAPVAAELITNTLSSVLFVLLYGLIAEAFLQVRDDGRDRIGGDESTDPVDRTPA